MLGFEESTSIFDFLKAEQMIDARGKVQDKLRQALKEGTLTLPPEYAAHLPQVKEVLRKVAGKLDIKNADERVTVKTRQAVLQSAEFQALWERIKHKTRSEEHTYELQSLMRISYAVFRLKKQSNDPHC